MAISDLQARQGKVELIANVVEKGDIREFNKFGKAGRVCNATIEDPTGRVKLTLWNEQIDQVKLGDKIQISNGYVGEWQGELQLSTGKFGTLQVLGSSCQSEKGSAENTPEQKQDFKQETTEDKKDIDFNDMTAEQAANPEDTNAAEKKKDIEDNPDNDLSIDKESVDEEDIVDSENSEKEE